MNPPEIKNNPIIFDAKNNKDVNKINMLKKEHLVQHVIDNYSEQLKEYFEITNPSLVNSVNFNKQFKDFVKNKTQKYNFEQLGNWVFFPWNSTLVHILKEEEFYKVRTARNKYLISEEEQLKFYNSKVGIAGLSVGNNVALTIVLQGGAKHIKLADHDILALSNTNRIRTSISNLGLPKVEMTARQIYEINPYSIIEIFKEGINHKNIDEFCKGLNILIDEIDNLAIKLILRTKAKKYKIPLLMGADNGNEAIVDIERHDLNSKIPFFHGRLGNITYEKLLKLNKFETGKTIAQLVGSENHTERMFTSLQEMGKSIISWPQLGGTAVMNGAAVAYCAKQIICGNALVDNRGILSLDKIFQKDYFSKKVTIDRNKIILKFKKIFNI